LGKSPALRQVPLLALAALLAGCLSTPPPPEVGSPAAPTLRVRAVADYYWPAPKTVGDVEIEVFPVVDVLVVDRPGGPPLGPGDVAASRRAARAYCSARGGTLGQDAEARVADGTIAFRTCSEPTT
jgi:hypothetical protein